MNRSTDPIDEDAVSLDPPGSITVVGAGVLGIEAALYGRFLGYDVTIIEAIAIGHSFANQQANPLPLLPDRCLSPLALAALSAQQQRPSSGEGQTLPITYQQWIDDALVPLTETDLLRARLRIPRRVTQITTIPVEPDEAGEPTSDIPPDFRLTLVDEQAQCEALDSEAVILATGSSHAITLEFEPPIPFFYRIGANPTGDVERDIVQGRREIVGVFGNLAGRAELDLYRPRRV